MLAFWRNPEFVRHARAELRPVRALTAGLVVLVIMTLVGLGCWSSEQGNNRAVLRTFYAWLVGLQYGVLSIWCMFTCGQAISREREMKTYDFLKTTRLTAAELLVGKILGEPVMGYFLAGCSLFVSIVVGLLGGFSLRTLLWTYVLLVFLALFVSVGGLWGSMLGEKTNAALAGLVILAGTQMCSGFADSPFPGLAAFSIFPALFTLYHVREFSVTRIRPTLFGWPVHFAFLTVLLYVLFGAWLVLMLLRNLKRDREQVRLFSRWQAVGFAAFLNVLFYLFLDPRWIGKNLGYGGLEPKEVSILAVGFNSAVLFLVGLATLSPAEKLRGWWKRRKEQGETYFSARGLPWPWLVPAALIAYALLAAEAAGLRRSILVSEWRLGTAAVQLGVFLIFTVRDILFLQWCLLTRMKRPVGKGFLYLVLYYSAVGILSVVASTVKKRLEDYVLCLSPFYAFNSKGVRPQDAPALYLGLVLQIPVIIAVLNAIRNRLKRPPAVPTPSEV